MKREYQYKDIFNIKMDGGNVLDVDNTQKRVKAVWARCGNIDLDNDIIVPEAFTKTIKERGPKGKNLIWSLVDHCPSMDMAIGKPEELYIEGDMLIAITPIVDTEKGEDMLKMYEDGLINQHSIGFATINSDVDKNGVRTIRELKLYEGSAVLWGANPETPTLDVKSEFKRKGLSDRLENLLKSFKGGRFTDETFSLMEIEIKRIQKELDEIEVSATTTQPAKAVEPEAEKKSSNDEIVLKELIKLNNLLKS